MALDYKTELEKYRRYYQNFEGANLQPKQRAYTTAIFSFLAVSLFGWYAIRPTISTILFLQRQIADNKVVNQQMEDKIGKLIDAQASYQQIESKLPLLERALPKNPEAINVASQLKLLAATSQASISAINIAQVPLVAGAATTSVQTTAPVKPSSGVSALPNRKIMDIPINVILEGTYPHLLTYLGGVVNLRRIVTVNSVSFIPAEAGGGLPGVGLRMVLKLTAHYIQ